MCDGFMPSWAAPQPEFMILLENIADFTDYLCHCIIGYLILRWHEGLRNFEEDFEILSSTSLGIWLMVQGNEGLQHVDMLSIAVNHVHTTKNEMQQRNNSG